MDWRLDDYFQARLTMTELNVRLLISSNVLVQQKALVILSKQSS